MVIECPYCKIILLGYCPQGRTREEIKKKLEEHFETCPETQDKKIIVFESVKGLHFYHADMKKDEASDTSKDD